MQILLNHLAAITDGQVTSAVLPGPNLGLCFPIRIFVQFIVGFFVRAIDHVFIAHVQSALLQNIEQFETLHPVISGSQTKVQAVPVSIALLLRPVQVPFQGVECKRKQMRSGQTGNLGRQTGKQIHVAQIMVSNLVCDDKRNLLVAGTSLVKPPGEVDIATRRGEGSNHFQPGDFNHQAFGWLPARLKALFHTSDAVNRPCLGFEVDCLMHLLMKPLPERGSLFKLKIMRHIRLLERFPKDYGWRVLADHFISHF